MADGAQCTIHSEVTMTQMHACKQVICDGPAVPAGIVIETGTFTQLAAVSLNAGNFEQAEMMLEQRDYL